MVVLLIVVLIFLLSKIPFLVQILDDQLGFSNIAAFGKKIRVFQ